MKNQKNILIATGIFLLISFIFLSWTERQQADINARNLWMIYFENPKDNSLNFTIENHSTDTNFLWQLSSDKSVIDQGDINVKTGETKTVTVLPADMTGKKIDIVVTSGENKKELYKNL